MTARYFRAPASPSELDEAARAWWDSLPPPAKTVKELDERQTVAVEREEVVT